MGELIFTFAFGGSVVVHGIILLTFLRRTNAKKDEVLSKNTELEEEDL